MRNQFDKQLDVMHASLVEMGQLCETAIEAALAAVETGDGELARQAVEADSHIDEKEREIESMCLKLLLQQQPVARDLRTISAALKMISDLERIGDQSTDIAEISRHISRHHTENYELLHAMATAASAMVRGAVTSFVDRDEALAQKTIGDDDAVDQLFLTVKRQLIERVVADSADGEYYLDLLMIAKYFERIADHATNVAEWVLFSITGSREG